MIAMYPLKFRPILKSLIWGGEKIAPFKGIETDMHNIGESWELSGVKGNESVVANGEFEGMTIRELLVRFRGELVGKKNYERFGNEFPLLVKFIDAKQDLSIQVHPDDVLAAKRHASKGKTEMWYVVQADENAHLRSGFSRRVTPEEYERSVADNTITDILADYRITPGDLFFLPAGRVHSIGAGSFIAEIQQTSDITYRIYDFNRLGADGKPRELHTSLAKDAIDYTVLDDYRTHYTPVPNAPVPLVNCDYFTVCLYSLTESVEIDMTRMDSFVIVVCIAGEGTLTDGNGNKVSLHRGETLLLPATSGKVSVCPSGKFEFLSSRI